jgi:hypothetical protein
VEGGRITMRKERKLAKEAKNAASRLGHEIAPFTFTNSQEKILGRSHCKHCNMAAYIDTQAMMSENAIKGEAVELYCVTQHIYHENTAVAEAV